MSESRTKTATSRLGQVPVLEYPSQTRESSARKQCLILMVPGNPGLIGYYEPFLMTLRQLLDEKEAGDGCRYAFHIRGQNLLGFADEDHEPAFGTASPTHPDTTIEPFGLEDQIRAVCEQVQRLTSSALEQGRPFDEVVLIGHSVGAYIALEVFHRHHLARQGNQAGQSRAPPGTPPPGLGAVPLKAGILLFPTVSHIARSASGQKLDLLRRTPWLDRTAHHVARAVVDLLPHWLRAAAVRRLMGFPDHAAAATLRFLAARDAIWQALHLGKDEMRTITEERWADEMWEVQEAEARKEKEEEEEGQNPGAPRSGTKFFFYFAEKDHWVADECRDEFIEKRRRHEKGRTRVVVDEAGVPHAFCIHHSETVAEKVKGWIEDIAGL